MTISEDVAEALVVFAMRTEAVARLHVHLLRMAPDDTIAGKECRQWREVQGEALAALRAAGYAPEQTSDRASK